MAQHQTSCNTHTTNGDAEDEHRYPNPSSSSAETSRTPLLIAFTRPQTVLIVGAGTAGAAQAAFRALESGARVHVLRVGSDTNVNPELAWRAQRKQLQLIEDDLDIVIERVQPTLAHVATPPAFPSLQILLQKFSEKRVPVYIEGFPHWSDFVWPETKKEGCVQLAVTTAFTSGLGDVGEEETVHSEHADRDIVASRILLSLESYIRTQFGYISAGIHALHHAWTRPSSDGLDNQERRRRLDWLTQIMQYHPLKLIGGLRATDVEGMLEKVVVPSQLTSTHTTPQRGQLYIVGSGPGHPQLLTVAAYNILTRKADLIVSDKLVGGEILNLVEGLGSSSVKSPTKLVIAKKYPGNADRAQEEMMQVALEGVRRGEVVVRLKQGTPSLYARTAEELVFFRAHGIEPIVIPGVSSALAGVELAITGSSSTSHPDSTAPIIDAGGMMLTMRGVAEGAVFCTGVGRGGRDAELDGHGGGGIPGYVRSRTVVIMMGNARVERIIGVLTGKSSPSASATPYPSHLPIALIERASFPDQRVIESTLEHIVEASQSAEVGKMRVPGMMMIGWGAIGCHVPRGATEWEQFQNVLEEDENDTRDGKRVELWLGGRRWRVREGLPVGWGQFETGIRL